MRLLTELDGGTAGEAMSRCTARSLAGQLGLSESATAAEIGSALRRLWAKRVGLPGTATIQEIRQANRQLDRTSSGSACSTRR